MRFKIKRRNGRVRFLQRKSQRRTLRQRRFCRNKEFSLVLRRLRRGRNPIPHKAVLGAWKHPLPPAWQWEPASEALQVVQISRRRQ